MSNKLFQHLVSESHTRQAAQKITEETVKRFRDGVQYNGMTRTYAPLEEGGEPLPNESKEVVTTVPVRLAYTEAKLVEMYDFELIRDEANMRAKADLVVDGVTIAKDLPSTLLLSLEKRLVEYRSVLDAIPTLDLSKKWQAITNESDKFQSGPDKTYRTAKKTEAVILHPATKEHAAQVQPAVVDKTIGTFETTLFSGAVHPGTKRNLLERTDRLIDAVKKARMKANTVETNDSLKIGAPLFEYIHAGDKK